MVDNVTLNSGTGGATAATDDVAGVHYQRVKLVDGTLDSTAAIAGDATNGLDVDVTRLIPGVGATNLGKAEDAAHSTGDVGVMSLAVRNDTLAALAGTTGDYAPIQVNATGAVYVQEGSALDVSAATVTVDNAGTFAVQVDGNALTALQLIDDPVFADDAAFTLASSKVMMAGGIRDDALTTLTAIEGDAVPLRVDANGALHVNVSAYTDSQTDDTAFTPGTDSVAMVGATFDDATPDSVDEGDGGALRMSARRELYVQLRDAAGNERGLNVDASGQIAVTGTVTANLSATDNAVLDNIDTNTSAATSHYRNVDANAEAAIKGSAGTLHWMHVMNMTAAVAYLHLYDATTANVTPGVTTPTYTFPIPTQGDTNGAGFNLPLGPNGQAFANAITLVVTTTIDGSTGDPGTNGVFVNAGYT